MAVDIYKLTDQGKFRQDYGLRDQMRRSAVSVPSCIAEGDERDTAKEAIRFFYIAKGSLAELRTQLDIALNINYIVEEVFQDLEEKTIIIGKMLRKHDAGPIETIDRLPLTSNAGDQALALQINTRWGTCLILNNFDRKTKIQGMRFKGKLAVSGKSPDGKTWALASEAETFKFSSLGFSDQAPAGSDPVHAHTTDSVTMKTPQPEGWSYIPDDCQNYALVMDGKYQKGYPINKIEKNRINLSRFPLMMATHCTVPSFYYQLKNAVKN